MEHRLLFKFFSLWYNRLGAMTPVVTPCLIKNRRTVEAHGSNSVARFNFEFHQAVA